MNHWLVGASWDGENVDEKFVENGYWMFGYAKGDKEKAQRLYAEQIKKGDRLAIKRMSGPGVMKIIHIGTVTGFVEDTPYVICQVNWTDTYMERKVACNGYCKTIHKPIDINDTWAQEIFAPKE